MLRAGDPAVDGVVHDVIDLTDVLPVWLPQHVVAFVIEKLRADVVAVIIVEEGLYHAGAGVLSHEVHPEKAQAVLHLQRESKGPVTAPVDDHELGPQLVHIGSGGCLIIQDVGLGFFDVCLDRIEAPVTGPVQGQEALLIGSSDKDALAPAVLREPVVRDLVGLLLAGEEGLDLLHAFGAGRSQHFRHLDDPVALHLPVDVLVIHPLQIVGEPLVLQGQEAEEAGLPEPLVADQTEHDLELAAGVVYPLDSAQHEQLQAFISQVVFRGTQEMMKDLPDPFPAVPGE